MARAELWALIPGWRESRIFQHSEWQAGKKKKKKGWELRKAGPVTEAKGIVFVCRGKKKETSKGLRYNAFLFFFPLPSGFLLSPPVQKPKSHFFFWHLPAMKASLNEKLRACLGVSPGAFARKHCTRGDTFPDKPGTIAATWHNEAIWESFNSEMGVSSHAEARPVPLRQQSHNPSTPSTSFLSGRPLKS